MRVVVSGGRVRVSRNAVETVLDRLSRTWPADTVVIHGDARGTDRLAGNWAKDRGFRVQELPVDSALDGFEEDAPKNRNTRLAAERPDLVVIFPGGPGSKDMLKKAEREGLTIYDVEIGEKCFSVWRLIAGRGQAERVATGVFA